MKLLYNLISFKFLKNSISANIIINYFDYFLLTIVIFTLLGDFIYLVSSTINHLIDLCYITDSVFGTTFYASTGLHSLCGLRLISPTQIYPLQYNIFIYKHRMLHNTSVLSAPKKNTGVGSVNKNSDSLSDIPLSPDAEEILKSNLDTLRNHSHSMTMQDLYLQNKEIFENSFSPLIKAKIERSWENLKISAATEKSVDILNREVAPKNPFLSSFFNMPGNNFYDKWYSLYNNSNTDTNKTNEIEIRKISDEINNEAGALLPSYSDKGKLFEMNSDGKLVIDINKFEIIYQSTLQQVISKFQELDIENIYIAIFSLSNLIAYRTIVKAHTNSVNIDLSKFNSVEKQIALKAILRNKLTFNTVAALGIICGFYGLNYLRQQLIFNSVQVNVSSTSSSNTQASLLIFLFTQFKKLNIWLKIILIFIIMPIIIYSSYPYLSYLYIIFINFLNNHIFKLKLLLCLIVILHILFDVLTLYLINIFSRLNDKPILNKYIPSFISNEIFSIYKISKSSENNKSIIIGIYLKNIILLILLLLYLLALLLI